MPEDQGIDELERDEDEERFVRMSREDIRKLERKGASATELETKNQELERELVFRRAGVDVDSKVGKLLMKGWDGELDVEAIKAEASEIGALAEGNEPPPPPVENEPGEEGASDERSSLGAGANADAFRTSDPDPREQAVKAGRAAIDAGATEEDALGVAFDTIARAGIAGDKRAVWDPQAQ